MAIFFIAPAAGCGGTVALKAPIDQAPLIEPAPISVAISYSQNLRDHLCTGDGGYIRFSWSIALGPPSIEMFDAIFPALFSDVEILGLNPKAASVLDQRDIVEVRLTDYTGCEARWPILGTTFIVIAYEAIVRSAEGKKIAQWKGQGQAYSGDDLGMLTELSWEPELAHLSRLTSLAMRHAAADFIVNFESDPAVRVWLGK